VADLDSNAVIDRIGRKRTAISWASIRIIVAVRIAA
jgi:hypothetical protein